MLAHRERFVPAFKHNYANVSPFTPCTLSNAIASAPPTRPEHCESWRNFCFELRWRRSANSWHVSTAAPWLELWLPPSASTPTAAPLSTLAASAWLAVSHMKRWSVGVGVRLNFPWLQPNCNCNCIEVVGQSRVESSREEASHYVWPRLATFFFALLQFLPTLSAGRLGALGAGWPVKCLPSWPRPLNWTAELLHMNVQNPRNIHASHTFSFVSFLRPRTRRVLAMNKPLLTSSEMIRQT